MLNALLLLSKTLQYDWKLIDFISSPGCSKYPSPKDAWNIFDTIIETWDMLPMLNGKNLSL